MAIAARETQVAIGVNRFGLGARPDEPLPGDPRAWLVAQFERYQALPPAWAAQPGTGQLALNFFTQQRQIRQAAAADKLAARKAMRQQVQAIYQAAVTARATSALLAPAPFVEKLVHFWANHFAVSTETPVVATFAGAFEAEAIRPHVLGRFEDMLLAAERHPAMQFYLNQTRSVGPASPAALRAERRHPDHSRGLNENLGREIMELHTLGARSGYSQADVTEFSRALTGWSIVGLGAAPGPEQPLPGPARGRPAAGTPGDFVFHPQFHEPGVRTIMGHRYDQPNEAQALAALRDFAAAPATATHLATKLARHFVADTPSPALVQQLARVFLQSGGDLPSVYRALIAAPEAWASSSAKFKTPWEWTISSWRGLGLRDLDGLRAAPLLTQLGQPVWRPGSPAGYDDIAASWAAPDALVLRVELARRFAARAGDQFDPRTLAARLLPGSLGAATRQAIARADSTGTGLALLLVSPDFQRT